MAIPHLCNDILLRIVELCDLETILTLKKVPVSKHTDWLVLKFLTNIFG